MNFENLPALDDYELIKQQFKTHHIVVKPIEFNAFFYMRDEFSQYFNIEKRKISICLLDFFKNDFFLLMPVYSTLEKIYNSMGISLTFHLNMFAQSKCTKEKINTTKYQELIPEFLCMICNLK